MSGSHQKIPTVSSEVFEGSASSLLNTNITTVEEVEDRIEGFSFDGLLLFLSNFCECKGGRSLKVEVLRKRECCQCS